MSNLAREKFKELDVRKERLWIMLLNLIILKNLINSCLLVVKRNVSYFTLNTGVAWLSTVLIAIL